MGVFDLGYCYARAVYTLIFLHKGTFTLFCVQGGSLFCGTVFLSRSAEFVAQGLPFLSCMLLGVRNFMRYFGISVCRQNACFFDAQYTSGVCVDRWDAVCDHITFSFLRFCGVSFQACVTVAGLLWESFFVRVCIDRHFSGLWVCRMAAPVVPAVQ